MKIPEHGLGGLRARLRALSDAFEVDQAARIKPMEGMRGIAVMLVFLQHYCRQFIEDGHLGGATLAFASAFRTYGNNGVELFFVLSGFLIYGILLRKRPAFLDFMKRRAQRLYPAFLAALVVAGLADIVRPHPYVPAGLLPAAKYLLANLLFLPGLLPITPLSAVNWSLSYEWWFYVSCTLLFATLGLGLASPRKRIALIVSIGAALVALSALNVPYVPVRGLSLLMGILLAESEQAGLPPVTGWIAIPAVIVTFVLNVSGLLPPWANAIALGTGFYFLCSCAFFGKGRIADLLCIRRLRHLGNISYSFYLVHGFAVVAALHLLLGKFSAIGRNSLFWLSITPVFALALAFGAALFLMIERPFSLKVREKRKMPEAATAIA